MSSYVGGAAQDGYTIEKIMGYGAPVFKISKIDSSKKDLAIKTTPTKTESPRKKKDYDGGICLGFKTVDTLLSMERAIISLLSAKNNKLIFQNYLKALNKLSKNRRHNLLADKAEFFKGFVEQTLIHFKDLILYDIAQIDIDRTMSVVDA